MTQSNILKTLSISGYDGKRLFIMFLCVIIALIIDISISSVADIVSKQAVSIWGIILFVLISAIFVIGQYFISESIKSKIKESKIMSDRLRILQKMVTIVQYTLTVITLI